MTQGTLTPLSGRIFLALFPLAVAVALVLLPNEPWWITGAMFLFFSFGILLPDSSSRGFSPGVASGEIVMAAGLIGVSSLANTLTPDIAVGCTIFMVTAALNIRP